MVQTTNSPLLGLPLANLPSIHPSIPCQSWYIEPCIQFNRRMVQRSLLSPPRPTPAHQRPETLLTIRTHHQQQSTIHINGHINQQHNHQISERRRGCELHNSSFSENSSTVVDYWALRLHKTKRTTIIVTFNILLDKNTQYVGGESTSLLKPAAIRWYLTSAKVPFLEYYFALQQGSVVFVS